MSVGRVVYTSMLDERGGFTSDLTIMRLGHDHFRVVTGAHSGMTEKKWFLDHLPDDGSAQLSDLTSSWSTFGLWGPRARDVLGGVYLRRRESRGLPLCDLSDHRTGRHSRFSRRASPTSVNSAGRSTCRCEEGAKAWDSLFTAGRDHGLVPVGIGVYATTGRLEKGYRALGNELTADYTIVEAGMARPTVKKPRVHRT